ncbi:MAG: hypothetical protein IPK37_04970 [Austwickia sp.]|jgi:hypothetical protein|nr:MAG: hypothetical protein IPK37_04970 [Austwickia sp.]
MTTLSAPVEADAAELRRLRRDMLTTYASSRGCGELRPRTIRLPSGDGLQVDGANDDETLILEIVTHADAESEGLRARIGQALLGLSLARRARPNAQLVLLVANETVRRAATGWVPALDGDHPVILATPHA